MPNASTPIDQTMQLSLTADEVAAIHALAAGIAELAEREIEPSAAVVAAVDRGLERLLEDFELSQSTRTKVEQAFKAQRGSWPRGNCCL
jgi:hypothetical protein